MRVFRAIVAAVVAVPVFVLVLALVFFVVVAVVAVVVERLSLWYCLRLILSPSSHSRQQHFDGARSLPFFKQSLKAAAH